MYKLIMKLLSSSRDIEVLRQIESSKINSKHVVGRGTLVQKSGDISSSAKFLELSRKAGVAIRRNSLN